MPDAHLHCGKTLLLPETHYVMLRQISLTIRSLQKNKEVKRTLAKFEQGKTEIAGLKSPQQKSKKLLIIRLDDIGDYLLFRDTIATYKQSPRWQGYEITLLGYTLWKDLFNAADKPSVDNTIWINKHDCFADPELFRNICQQLRNEGFSAVVCPSRIRPLLLDDMFMLAADAPLNIGSGNDFSNPALNIASDKLYQELYADEIMNHEFLFNKAFATWCNKLPVNAERLTYPHPALPAPHAQPYVLCFVGASVQSRRWTAERWIEFINLCNTAGRKVVIAGGKNDLPIAETIVAATAVESITGKVSLPEMVNWIAHAQATITNDTMASHLSVALARPTVVVASGDNFFKFSEYKAAGIKGVTTLYPAVFLKKWAKLNHMNFKNHIAVTNDIATIPATEVFAALDELLKGTTTKG